MSWREDHTRTWRFTKRTVSMVVASGTRSFGSTVTGVPEWSDQARAGTSSMLWKGKAMIATKKCRLLRCFCEIPGRPAGKVWRKQNEVSITILRSSLVERSLVFRMQSVHDVSHGTSEGKGMIACKLVATKIPRNRKKPNKSGNFEIPEVIERKELWTSFDSWSCFDKLFCNINSHTIVLKAHWLW